MIRLLTALALVASAEGCRPPPESAEPNVLLSAAEIDTRPHLGAGTGTSGIAGIDTIMLEGDVNGVGPYVMEIRVPAHTRIEAHNHPDDRAATVVSGTWHFGYGERFDAAVLKALPPGSFYTEPARGYHFAQTGDEPVVVHISGRAPTGVHYAQ